MKNYLKTSFDLNDPFLISMLDEVPLWSAPFGIKLLEAVIMKKNIRALDIGFGNGFPLLELAMRLGNTCEVYGIDPWDAAHERTKEKIKLYGLKNVKIINAKAEKMPFDDDFFDLAVSNNGINNVTDINQALGECARVCKPGAQFIITMNLEDTMIEFYSIYEGVLKGKGMDKEAVNLRKHIYEKRKPLNEIKTLLRENGFITDVIEFDKFRYRYTDGTTMLNHFLIKLAFLDSWKEVLPERTREEIFTETEKRINEQAERDGEFVLTVPYAIFDCHKN